MEWNWKALRKNFKINNRSKDAIIKQQVHEYLNEEIRKINDSVTETIERWERNKQVIQTKRAYDWGNTHYDERKVKTKIRQLKMSDCLRIGRRLKSAKNIWLQHS